MKNKRVGKVTIFYEDGSSYKLRRVRMVRVGKSLINLMVGEVPKVEEYGKTSTVHHVLIKVEDVKKIEWEDVPFKRSGVWEKEEGY